MGILTPNFIDFLNDSEPRLRPAIINTISKIAEHSETHFQLCCTVNHNSS